MDPESVCDLCPSKPRWAHPFSVPNASRFHRDFGPSGRKACAGSHIALPHTESGMKTYGFNTRVADEPVELASDCARHLRRESQVLLGAESLEPRAFRARQR